MMKTLIAVLLLAAASSTAFADDAAPKAVVSFGDLNLDNPAGAATLRQRIDRTILFLINADGSINMTTLEALASARANGRAQAECLIAAAKAKAGIGS